MSVLGGVIGDGRVPPDQAPILLATATATWLASGVSTFTCCSGKRYGSTSITT